MDADRPQARGNRSSFGMSWKRPVDKTAEIRKIRQRLTFAQAQWAAMSREGPAHKRADLVQTLGRIDRHIQDLEARLTELG